MISYRQFLPLTLVVLFAILPAALAMSSAGAQDDDRVTESPEIASFSKLTIEGAGDATITIGNQPSLTIEAPELIAKQIDVSVSDEMLTVGFIESTALDVIGEADIIYTITAPSLEEIHLSGSINATVTELETPSLFLGLTTFAELHIDNLLVTDLEAELNFSSTAHLSGIADTQRLTLDNASTYNAADLSSRTAEVDLSELSEATVRVTESVMGSVKTASSLGYIGEDVNAEVDSSGLAKIELLPFTPPLFNMGTPVASAPMEAAVEVRAFTFDPYVVEIAAGGTVTWTNFDMIPHNIADSPDGATFRSPQLARGQEYSVTFDEPGTYDYYCPLHPIMAGQVVVVES